jgi:hypothetical protein
VRLRKAQERRLFSAEKRARRLSDSREIANAKCDHRVLAEVDPSTSAKRPETGYEKSDARSFLLQFAAGNNSASDGHRQGDFGVLATRRRTTNASRAAEALGSLLGCADCRKERKSVPRPTCEGLLLFPDDNNSNLRRPWHTKLVDPLCVTAAAMLSHFHIPLLSEHACLTCWPS